MELSQTLYRCHQRDKLMDGGGWVILTAFSGSLKIRPCEDRRSQKAQKSNAKPQGLVIALFVKLKILS